jgi:beta-phosphoglucomutase family hydrolase
MPDASAVGLPETIAACLFDMDGVLTDTAKVHTEAWKRTFDEFLAQRPGQAPFDPVADYDAYVDGRPRYDGVAAFLRSRGIDADDETVHRLGDRKNDLVLRLIHERGVEAYPGSVRYLHAARDVGLKTAVVSSSANAHDVLQVAGIAGLLDVRVDGETIEREHLAGKPAPDAFLRAASELGVTPPHAAVFEDALAGVESGHAGGFGCVVGVDRVGQADALRAHGASVVVSDLAGLLP